jgi:DNA-binding PadR family transcriptional regulator
MNRGLTTGSAFAISISDMSGTESDVAELLPLTPASFQILVVLAGGSAHGYAIMQEVERLTGGTAHLGPGTLYRTIQKLLDDKLVEAIGSDADERRVPYRISRRGTAVARAETRRLAMLVEIAEKRGLTTPAGRPKRSGARV